MADVAIRLNGEDNVSDAFKDAGRAAGSFSDGVLTAAQALGGLEGIGKKAKDMLVDFTKESIRAFADQEKANKQLQFVAGENTEAFKAQAAAFQEHLGVSDDMVQRMQTLALRFKTLPTDVGPATEAILNWAAATGGDAEGGMTQLTRAVEFGTGKIKGLGVEFEATGDKAEDMRRAISALNEKFGGSADVMADTLSGRTSRVSAAFDELKEAFGGAINEIDQRAGALDKLAAGLKNLGDVARVARNVFSGNSIFQGTQYGDADPVSAITNPAGGGQGTLFGGISLQSDVSGEGSKFLGGGAGSQGDAMLSHQRKRAAEAEKIREANYRAMVEWEAKDVQLDADNLKAKEIYALKYLEQLEQQNQAEQDAYAKQLQFGIEYDLRQEKRRAEAAERERQQVEDAAKRLEQMQMASAQRLEEKMTSAALAIGTAFGRALTQAIVQAIDEGQELDVEGAAIDIGFGLASAVGAAIGSIYNPAIGQAIGTGIAGIGQIASAVHRRNRKEAKKRHEGGWIDGERFHDGGFIGLGSDERAIVAQDGEAILSRRHVANMGGRAGVERAARGGAAVVVNLSGIMDAGGVREFFEDRGGRGFYNAIRTGRGSLAQTGLGVL